jgi:hypothetical protein
MIPPNTAKALSRTSATARCSPPVEPVHRRHQQGGEDHGQRHRHDDHLEALEQPQQRHDRGEDDQQAPGPGCCFAHEGIDGVGVTRRPAGAVVQHQPSLIAAC